MKAKLVLPVFLALGLVACDESSKDALKEQQKKLEEKAGEQLTKVEGLKDKLNIDPKAFMQKLMDDHFSGAPEAFKAEYMKLADKMVELKNQNLSPEKLAEYKAKYVDEFSRVLKEKCNIDNPAMVSKLVNSLESKIFGGKEQSADEQKGMFDELKKMFVPGDKPAEAPPADPPAPDAPAEPQPEP